jgi:putative membrane protein
MVTDHSKANKELEALATRLGVTPPKQLSGHHASEVKRLSKLTGAKFDQEYSEHMIKDHEKASALFEKQAKRGDAEELKQFAAQTLPVLQEHLKMAKSLTTQKK